MSKVISVRGANYRRAMREIGPNLEARARVVAAHQGQLTAIDIGKLAKEFCLPVKTTFNFLEYRSVLPSGTWDRLADRGVTAMQIRQAVEDTRHV